MIGLHYGDYSRFHYQGGSRIWQALPSNIPGLSVSVDRRMTYSIMSLWVRLLLACRAFCGEVGRGPERVTVVYCKFVIDIPELHQIVESWFYFHHFLDHSTYSGDTHKRSFEFRVYQNSLDRLISRSRPSLWLSSSPRCRYMSNVEGIRPRLVGLRCLVMINIRALREEWGRASLL